ncbi:hypothetical protein OB920_05625 [Halobacteria archaeon HArc-gm2]|nr:hypothetical protein [Halobacteria archaeon HArc-gm2]
MASGEDKPNPEDGRILSPEELDIDDDEHVEQIDDGRYVVSPNVRTDSTASVSQSDQSPERSREQPRAEPQFTDTSVHQWLHENLEDTNSQYGFDVTAKFDGTVSQQQMVSNDIVTVFESLMLWYARQIDADTPVEEVLGILLSESNVPVTYPPSSIQTLVQTEGLSPDDSIADLLAAVGEDGGVQR